MNFLYWDESCKMKAPVLIIMRYWKRPFDIMQKHVNSEKL